MTFFALTCFGVAVFGAFRGGRAIGRDDDAWFWLWAALCLLALIGGYWAVWVAWQASGQ